MLHSDTAVENVLVAMPLTKIGGRNFHQQNKLVHGHTFPGKKGEIALTSPFRENWVKSQNHKVNLGPLQFQGKEESWHILLPMSLRVILSANYTSQ